MVGKFKKFVDVVEQEIKEVLVNDSYILHVNFSSGQFTGRLLYLINKFSFGYVWAPLSALKH